MYYINLFDICDLIWQELQTVYMDPSFDDDSDAIDESTVIVETHNLTILVSRIDFQDLVKRHYVD